MFQLRTAHIDICSGTNNRFFKLYGIKIYRCMDTNECIFQFKTKEGLELMTKLLTSDRKEGLELRNQIEEVK